MSLTTLCWATPLLRLSPSFTRTCGDVPLTTGMNHWLVSCVTWGELEMDFPGAGSTADEHYAPDLIVLSGHVSVTR